MSLLLYLKYLIFPKPLELQLVEACEAIKGIRKLGTNEDLEFDYLRIMELSKELREELLPRGIVILPNDLECLEGFLDTERGRVPSARIHTEFTISDGRRSIKLCAYGSACDPNGYAVAIAQTMGFKALLKRLSMTYGDQDDPELARWAQVPRETQHQTKRQKEYQQRAWADGVRNSGMTAEQVDALLSEAMDRPITSEEITSLPVKEFDWAMQILLQHSDLSNILEMSRDQAKKGQQTAA